MASSNFVYHGLKAHVVALNKHTGRKVWRRPLGKGAGFTGVHIVSLLVEADRIYAHTRGQLYCLDAGTGAVLWENPLPGLGYDLCSLAVVGAATVPTDAQHLRARAAGAAVAGGAT